MKTKITIRLEADLLREIRELAADEGTTISAMVAIHLRQLVGERKVYRRARKRAMARLCRGMNLGWTPARFRSEVHERQVQSGSGAVVPRGGSKSQEG